MKLSIFIIIASLFIGCSSSPPRILNVKLNDYRNKIKLAKDVSYPISKLDKYSQIVLLLENEKVNEITYSYYVRRDEPSPIRKAKRISKSYFLLKVTHPSYGISIEANGFETKDLGVGVFSKDGEYLPDNFSGVLKVKLEPIKK